MADTRISQLGEMATVTSDDVIVVVDGTSSTTKKVQAGNMLPDGVVSTTKLVDNSVTAAKLATNAILLGKTEITAAASTSSTSAVQTTGLSVTVVIPSGGRQVEVTAFTGGLANGTAGNYAAMSLWEGAVGTGTQLQQGNCGPAANQQQAMLISRTYAPSAGTKTYNVGIQTTGGSVSLSAGTINPAYVKVEVK